MWANVDVKYDAAVLSVADPQKQIRIIEAWFRNRYEDPAHRTPYESAEGGYIWVNGGPYDAREQLEEQFHGIVPDEVIEEPLDKLKCECVDWAAVPGLDDYDVELYEAVLENDKASATLEDAVSAISSLLALSITGPEVNVHRRLLFSNVIAILETFLSDTFINRVIGDDILFQRYLDTEKAFQERTVLMKDSLRMASKIKTVATKELVEMVWHNIGKAKTLYADVLLVDLGDMAPIGKAINIRHDIVHRNGRQKDGTDLLITASDVTDLIGIVCGLARRIDLALKSRPLLGDSADLPF